MILIPKISNRPFLIISLLIVIASFISHTSAEAGTVTGRVVKKDGKPAALGMVIFYKKNGRVPYMPDKYRTEPEEIAFLDKDGNYRQQIKDGTYYFEAVLHSSSDMVGPPREGEYHGISIDEHGVPIEYIVTSGEDVHAGDITLLTQYTGLTIEDIDTGIAGKILDNSGNPLSDCVVFAYDNVSMKGNALFVSDITGESGSYVLGLSRGGTYYLSVQSFKEGAPQMIMVHGGNEPLPVTVETGRVITGIDFGQ